MGFNLSNLQECDLGKQLNRPNKGIISTRIIHPTIKRRFGMFAKKFIALLVIALIFTSCGKDDNYKINKIVIESTAREKLSNRINEFYPGKSVSLKSIDNVKIYPSVSWHWNDMHDVVMIPVECTGDIDVYFINLNNKSDVSHNKYDHIFDVVFTEKEVKSWQ